MPLNNKAEWIKFTVNNLYEWYKQREIEQTHNENKRT